MDVEIEATVDDVEALTPRLRVQTERQEALGTTIARSGEEPVRKAAAPSGPTMAPGRPAAATSRRGMLGRVMGASSVAALLLLAKQAPTAEATSRTTVLTGSASTGNFGIAAAVDVFDPATLIPNVTGLGFGVIGTFGSPGYAPPFNAGVLGQGSGASYGVIGLSQNNPGVHGQSTSSVGVIGKSTSSFAVYGRATSSVGTVGESDSGDGVYGVTVNGTGARGDSTNGVGVLGISANAIGVRGAGKQIGAWGQSTGGIGVYGTSATNSAIVGESSSGLAGEFRGNVFITGTLTAASKSAVVTMPDGSSRRLYCMEAPEALFEDVGEEKLVGGRAIVRLDRDFSATVRTDAYQVFLTPYGESRGLYVASRSAASFEVREVGGGTSDLAFGYRLVAKRKDPHGTRLESVSPPTRRIDADQRLPDRPRMPDLKTPPDRAAPSPGNGPTTP